MESDVITNTLDKENKGKNNEFRDDIYTGNFADGYGISVCICWIVEK